MHSHSHVPLRLAYLKDTAKDTTVSANPHKLQNQKMDKFESSSPSNTRDTTHANMFHSVLLAALTGLATANVYDLAFPTYKTSCANGCATWTDIGSNNKYTQVCVCECVLCVRVVAVFVRLRQSLSTS
jgi:hypothetical protein